MTKQTEPNSEDSSNPVELSRILIGAPHRAGQQAVLDVCETGFCRIEA